MPPPEQSARPVKAFSCSRQSTFRFNVHENLGLTRQYAPLVKVTDDQLIHYEINIDAFEAAIDSGNAKTRMFLLCNPHNPTGSVFTKKQLSQMAEVCMRHEVIICSDEIHSELLLDDTKHIPIGHAFPGNWLNIVSR